MADSAARKRPIRPPSMLEAAAPILLLIVLVILAQVLFNGDSTGGPFQIALIVCALVAGMIAHKNGHDLRDVGKQAVEGISSAMGAIFILLAVGALIGTWSMAGTTATLTYYGVKLISPQWFYLACVIICGLISLSIGSSWTTAGTIGVALIGISSVLGLRADITAGAIISGAYFGDKMSPLSDTTNLSPAIAGTDLYTHIRAMLWTTVPSIIATLIIFLWIGLRTEVSATAYDPTPALHALESSFNISLVTLIPLFLVLFLAWRRVPAFVAIMAGALAGGVIAVLFQPQQVITFANDPALNAPLALLKGVWASLANGYSALTGYPMIDELVSRGGMSSMLYTVWLILAAMMFGSIMDHTGSLRKLLEPLVRFARSAGRLMISAGLTAIFLNIFAGDQYMAIVLPGTIFKEEFRKQRVAPQMLSRQIEDTATITSPLIPWNTCGAYLAATLGVATAAYLPFCFFNLINPILSFVFDAAGFQIKRLDETTPEPPVPPPALVEHYGVGGFDSNATIEPSRE
ncbi:MAG: Na+/H+ antiporter NhaC [Anaerolineae bacterium]|nr:Na+/H+ antiporter NhaC [Anaerolineae bacterium]